LKTNKIYNIYDYKDIEYHISLKIYNINDIIYLVESSIGGIIRVWKFHSAILLNKLDIKSYYGNQILYGLCLWNNKYLFIGYNNEQILLLDLQNYK